MIGRAPRVAARALILDTEGRLLLVNAWPGGKGDLWCAPGGGVETGQSLTETLRREVMEECGIEIDIGAPAMVNEFHDPARGFHQIEIFFRCRIATWPLPVGWSDPAGVVVRRTFFSRAQMAGIRFKPDSLPAAAWGSGVIYDPLEMIVAND